MQKKTVRFTAAIYNDDLMEIELKIGSEVRGIREELQKTNESLDQLTQEIKRSNDTQNQVVEWLRYLAQHYTSSLSNVWSG